MNTDHHCFSSYYSSKNTILICSFSRLKIKGKCLFLQKRPQFGSLKMHCWILNNSSLFPFLILFQNFQRDSASLLLYIIRRKTCFKGNKLHPLWLWRYLIEIHIRHICLTFFIFRSCCRVYCIFIFCIHIEKVKISKKLTFYVKVGHFPKKVNQRQTTMFLKKA